MKNGLYGIFCKLIMMFHMFQRDKDPILRWSAMYTIAMAYAGTGNNQAIRKLLHVAVSFFFKMNIKWKDDTKTQDKPQIA